MMLIVMELYSRIGGKRMTTDDLINIATQFDKWLKEMAEKHGVDKDDIQEIVKEFLK